MHRLLSPSVLPYITKNDPTVPSVRSVPFVLSGPASDYSEPDSCEGVEGDTDDGLPLDDQHEWPLRTSRRAAAISHP